MKKLESQFLPENSEQLKDYQNLLEIMKNHNVNVNPSNYDNPEEDDSSQNNNNKNNNKQNNMEKRSVNKRKIRNRTKKKF